jgi:hypothetical protein
MPARRRRRRYHRNLFSAESETVGVLIIGGIVIWLIYELVQAGESAVASVQSEIQKGETYIENIPSAVEAPFTSFWQSLTGGSPDTAPAQDSGASGGFSF